MIENCHICGMKFETMMINGHTRRGVCRTDDHVVNQEWFLYVSNNKVPHFIANDCIISFKDICCVVTFKYDVPQAIYLLHDKDTIEYKINGSLDWKELPKILKAMKNNIAFI